MPSNIANENLVYKGKLSNPCMPLPKQELLLKAALLKGKESVEAWKAWKSAVDVTQVDSASHRMLPLLYRNLHTYGVKDTSMDIYKGVYRRTWYKNHILFHTISSLLISFKDENIPAMILKGAALTVLYYKDYGLRPMNDFDVLIHTENALPAIRLLTTLGWIPVDFMPTEEYVSVSYSHGFRNSSGQEFDLHWHLLSQSRGINDDNDFWDGAITANIHNIATYALNPTDQLFHICIHGARWNFTLPFRWVADAVTILNTSHAGIDWNRLIEQAEKRRLVLPLLDTLSYLKQIFRAPIAPDFFRSLAGKPVPKIDLLEYKIAVNPPSQWTAMLDLWCQHARLMGNTNLVYKIVRFPSFLQNIWGLSLWKIPFYGAFKMIRWSKDQLK